ncbi:MAG: YfgM family protein [Dissulfurimicrobium sp.]|uniref:YfgM family protein n=1 Tax=Dissulfurimicrobium TaxID=1769732 RepID=UPI003C740034
MKKKDAGYGAGASDAVKALAAAGLDQITDIVPARMIDFASEHIRGILVGVCAVILVLAVWAGYATYKGREEAKASLLLADAISEPTYEKAAELLDELVQKHGHTQASKEAVLILAGIYKDMGKTDQAIEAFSKAKGQFPKDSALFAASSLGLGYLNEEKHMFGQAKKEFAAAGRNKAFSAIATLDLARVSAASGDRDGALEAYDKYLSLTKEPTQLDFVRYKVMELSGEGIAPKIKETPRH